MSSPAGEGNSEEQDSSGQGAAGDQQEDENNNGFSSVKLPNVKKGQPVLCTDANLVEKQTTPPKYFTDATLLSAMTGIARYVSDPAIKKVLRETDGLGTEATRAGIIELLFKREYLTRKGKEIRATDIGKQLITSLPSVMGYPDMTAHWESQLEAISQREINYQHFMTPMTQGLGQLIDEVSAVEFRGLKGLGKPPKQWAKKKKPAAKPRKRAS
jgi:DNA topoisomerase-3